MGNYSMGNFLSTVPLKENKEFQNMLHEVASVLVEEEYAQKSVLLPKKALQIQKEEEFLQIIEQTLYRIQNGFMALLETLELLEKKEPSAFSLQLQQELSSFLKKTQEKPQELTIEGKKGYEKIGISNTLLQLFYKASKLLYDMKEYEKASHAFEVLTFLDDEVALFWLALGHSECFSSHYEKALIAYSVAEFLDPFDPTGFIYSARCYEKLNDLENAINALDLAICTIAEDASKKALIAEINEEKKRLENEVKK